MGTYIFYILRLIFLLNLIPVAPDAGLKDDDGVLAGVSHAGGENPDQVAGVQRHDGVHMIGAAGRSWRVILLPK